MVEQASTEIEEVDTVDAIDQAQDPDCLVIDIRDVRERKRNGYIPGSFHCPRGMIEFWVDPESPYFLPTILFDQHGVQQRILLSREFLQSGEYEKVAEVSDILHGLIGKDAYVERGDKKQSIRNFNEALIWLMEDAKKGLNIQRYKVHCGSSLFFFFLFTRDICF